MNSLDCSIGESALEYWNKTCAMSHEFHSTRTPVAEGDIRGFIASLDEMVMAIEYGNVHVEFDLWTKNVAPNDDLAQFKDQIGELYRQSVDRWKVNMDKLRLAAAVDRYDHQRNAGQ